MFTCARNSRYASVLFRAFRDNKVSGEIAMGMGLQEEVIEGFDLPDNYYTTCTYEDAGDGLVRVARYVRRRGVLVPVVNTVSSAAHLVKFGKDVSEFARQLLAKERGSSH
jgi:hypothetical protein